MIHLKRGNNGGEHAKEDDTRNQPSLVLTRTEGMLSDHALFRNSCNNN
jgi:hypothetical protein